MEAVAALLLPGMFLATVVLGVSLLTSDAWYPSLGHLGISLLASWLAIGSSLGQWATLSVAMVAGGTLAGVAAWQWARLRDDLLLVASFAIHLGVASVLISDAPMAIGPWGEPIPTYLKRDPESALLLMIVLALFTLCCYNLVEARWGPELRIGRASFHLAESLGLQPRTLMVGLWVGSGALVSASFLLYQEVQGVISADSIAIEDAIMAAFVAMAFARRSIIMATSCGLAVGVVAELLRSFQRSSVVGAELRAMLLGGVIIVLALLGGSEKLNQQEQPEARKCLK